MSRNFNSNTRVVNAPRKQPCCKVCKDAGKSETDYSSHWPRDDDGNTICPTLLAQECRYCHESGHTVKYCKKLAQHKASEEKGKHQEDRAKRIAAFHGTPKTKVEQAQTQSRFALLVGDDSDNEDEFPVLSKKSPQKDGSKQVAWSDMVSKVQTTPIVAKTENSGLFVMNKPREALTQREKAAAIRRQECFRGLNGRGWGDLDSDDDYDDVAAAEDAW
jgi:hypothetical protein